MPLRVEYDREADAVYIWLRDLPYAYGEDLDDQRRIDYGTDNEPIGVEFLNASDGVDLRGVEHHLEVVDALAENRIPVTT